MAYQSNNRDAKAEYMTVRHTAEFTVLANREGSIHDDGKLPPFHMQLPCLPPELEPGPVEDPVPLRRGHHLDRSEEHTSELQSLMRISYAVFCLKKKKKKSRQNTIQI